MDTMANRSPVRVAFVGGVRPAGNVRNFLANVRRLLRERPHRFQCDFLASGDSDPLEGFRHVDPGIEPAGSAVGTIRTMRSALLSYARAHSPDVLFQVTRFPTHGTATALAGRQSGRPTVTRLAGDNFTEHRFAVDRFTQLRLFGLKNLISLAAVHLPERVIVLGPNGHRQIEARGRSSGVREIPQPIDTRRFQPVSSRRRRELREELDLPDTDSRVLLTVGRLTRRKGLHDVAEAARKLEAVGAEVTWVVVGDGPLREELTPLSTVTVRGRVPHEDIPQFYRAADLLVHPSLHEGLPNVLLEATACELPSLARDVGEAGTVATETFEDPGRLPNLVLADYERPSLDERFDPQRLGKRYADVLVGATSA